MRSIRESKACSRKVKCCPRFELAVKIDLATPFIPYELFEAEKRVDRSGNMLATFIKRVSVKAALLDSSASQNGPKK
jgi:hypothetical protein